MEKFKKPDYDKSLGFASFFRVLESSTIMAGASNVLDVAMNLTKAICSSSGMINQDAYKKHFMIAFAVLNVSLSISSFANKNLPLAASFLSSTVGNVITMVNKKKGHSYGSMFYTSSSAFLFFSNPLAGLFSAISNSISIAGLFMNDKDFSNKNLSNKDFSSKDLQKYIFVNTDLTNSSFKEANLEEANFKGANLNGVDFRGAEFNPNTIFPEKGSNLAWPISKVQIKKMSEKGKKWSEESNQLLRIWGIPGSAVVKAALDNNPSPNCFAAIAKALQTLATYNRI